MVKDGVSYATERVTLDRKRSDHFRTVRCDALLEPPPSLTGFTQTPDGKGGSPRIISPRSPQWECFHAALASQICLRSLSQCDHLHLEPGKKAVAVHKNTSS
ncbi:unnamed protein product [Pleuronectes platessa]|uniref:Uncharacterized protein n=1 Tax=Pleuronectes platessa TaxID=8262 RepID=A0A9N7YJD2_PLEPL|nr:unnamed protein product [Pleuronectes platessa]